MKPRLLLLMVFVFSGCSQSSTSPVEGVVLLNGKPVPKATIQFVPQGAGKDATGETDQDGQFTMSTFQPRDGVVPGTYKIVITPLPPAAEPMPFATAEEAMSAAPKAKLKTDAASLFPQQYTRPDQTPLTQEVPTQGKLTLQLKN